MGIEKTVDRLTARWRAAPPVTIVASAGDLPFPAPADVEGAYSNGQVLLVADALTPGRAVQVLGHEAIGHHSLRATLGKAWPSFLSGVLAGSRRDALLGSARAHVERTYIDASGACELTHRQVADEVAAALAEARMNPAALRLQVEEPGRKQLAAVRGHLAREVLLLDHPVCGAQLEGTLLLAERRLRHGRTFFRWTAQLVDWYADRMAPPKPRPLHPTRPPMSVRESEELLRRANDSWRERLRAPLDIILFIGGPALVIFGIVSIFWNIATVLRWIFH